MHRAIFNTPVRDQSTNPVAVAVAAQALTLADGPVQGVVAPEGARGKARHWKTGFHFIALQARVPIILACVDFGRKVSGLRAVFPPCGDVQADMARVKRFHAPIKGHWAEHFTAE